ncbi:MAG: ABC transporter ATP-binding protein [Cyclobacteriaceae bacterium]
MLLTINKLSKQYDRGKVKALIDVSLQLKAGKVYAILGESGSGKTTLARLIAGLESPDQGKIYLNGKLISSDSQHLPAEKRSIGFVFQNYALFPHLNITKNVGYGISDLPNKTEVVDEMLRLVNLEGYGNRYPHELSGGQQQRVALARALALKPPLILLDEPFSNLDSSLRIDLRTEIFRILQQTGVCSVFITHNAEDAMAIADEVMILKDGQLLQQASPEILYQQPATPYVASLFDTLVEMSAILLEQFGFAPVPTNRYYLRSHHFSSNQPSDYNLNALVTQTTFMGQYYHAEVAVGDQTLGIHFSEKPAENHIKLGWQESDLLIF